MYELQNVTINVLLFFAFLFDISLGIFVFLKSKKTESELSFAAICLWVGLWTLGIVMFRILPFEQIYFWNQEFIFTAGLIASTFVQFSFAFVNRPLTLMKKFLLHLPNIFVLIGTLVPGVLIEKIVQRDWGRESILGWGYPLFGLYFSIFMLFGLYILFNAYLNERGTRRLQLLYIMSAVTFATSMGAYFNLYLILMGNYRYIWIGPYCSFIWVLINTYAITKHELMDIRVVISRGVAYGIVGVLLVASFVGLNASRMSPPFAMLTNALLAIFWVWGAHRLRAFIQTPLEEKWITGWYDPTKVMSRIVEKLVPVLEKDGAFGIVDVSRRQTFRHFDICQNVNVSTLSDGFKDIFRTSLAPHSHLKHIPSKINCNFSCF